ncbi:uncharacterized protein LOC102721556 [Oryza brachyantha]|uniref:uncharacterized protein LOC102721556 n=1 Tax=Oryza brachyantha TaxID=4533 RepID=UPI001ADB70FD|nr:uncharacterized protein LOC102721556 [Oryza brachyantha]
MTETKAFPAAAAPSRRDMRRRLRLELDAMHGLLGKAEALVALARKDVNGGAAAAAVEPDSALARRSPSRDRTLRRRGRSDREDNREEFDRARNRRGQLRDREEFDRSRNRRGQSNREEFDRARNRRGQSEREEFDRARKIEAVDVAPSPWQLEEGEVAPQVVAPSLCQLHVDGEIADDQSTGMDIDICGGVSPVLAGSVHFLSLAEQEDDEFVDVSGDASPVATGSSCRDASSSDSDSGDDDDGESSKKPDTAGRPTEAEATASPLEQDNEPAKGAAASPATQMRELIAIAQEKQQLQRQRERQLERKRAREALEELERNARPISDCIDPMDMRLLGLDKVQYITSTVESSESSRRPGGLLQQLGFFLKPEDHGSIGTELV